MPIKYNLTKYDMLAVGIHDVAQKKDGALSTDEETTRIKAILIASFSSPISWQTNKIITSGDVNALLGSPDVRAEHTKACTTGWKSVKNTEIQEVACLNMNGFFFIWLNKIDVDKNTKEKYKLTWNMLQNELFAAECDGVIVQRRN